MPQAANALQSLGHTNKKSLCLCQQCSDRQGYQMLLDDEQLLNVVAGGPGVHAVPGGVGEGTADGPHDGYGSFGGI